LCVHTLVCPLQFEHVFSRRRSSSLWVRKEGRKEGRKLKFKINNCRRISQQKQKAK
jgi:hypothetical protein